MKRLVLVSLAVLLIPVLAIVGQFRDDGLRDGLTAAGCRGVAAEHQVLRSRAVLSVSMVECLDEAGEVVPAVEAWEKGARIAWSSPAARFDGVFVTVYRSAAPVSRGPQSREFSRVELEERRGPRPDGLDWVPPDPTKGLLLLLVLPAIVTAVAVPIVLAVACARRGVVLFYWRSG